MAAICEDDKHQTNNDVNEINRFVDARYVSACEGCWRLFHYDLHERSPSIQRLDIRLPNQIRIVYVPGQATEALDPAKETTLTAWFICNRDYPKARSVPYHEFPEHFTWNSTACKWSPRKRRNTIGRLYSASPSEGERFCLCLLLHHSPGCTSFEDLRRLPDDTVADTYKATALGRGFLEDNREWHDCFKDATMSGFPT